MTTTLFAEMNAAMNSAIVDFLADAEADFGNGVVVSGLFRDQPAEAFDVIGGFRPTFGALSAALAAIENGDAVSINGAAYVVAEQQLRAGITTLVLELV